eukprot:GFKZ01008899.1.p1 GENE.GFKZ01008899.1~~GFKZ01008899.1.p1  ORF type:complete len:433 (-),score=46.21 GFKZ01008899.1:639-1937(-)
MDSRDWFFDPANVDAHLPTPDDMLTLPANVSTSSLWNQPPFVDVNLNLDALQPFPHLQEPLPQPAQQKPKPDDNVSDVTDAQLTTSPQARVLDFKPASPSISLNPRNNAAPPHRLKPVKKLSKPMKRSFMPALFLGDGRALARAASSEHIAQPPKTEKTPSQKRPTDDVSRQRHNQMMRENRGRFNKKFKELTDLLESLKSPDSEDKPMKNKIQILERAMYQYALMESQRASFKNELLFSAPVQQPVPSHEMDVMASAPTLQDACDIVVRNMCASMNWKYGEVWTRSYSEASTASHSNVFSLSSAFVSPKNMPATRRALQDFAKKGRVDKIDPLLLRLTRFKHAIWISDLTTKQTSSKRAQQAVSAGVSTMLLTPVTVNPIQSNRPDAIIVLMHVDDELLKFPGRMRPYDPQSVCRLTDLTSAVVDTRTSSP